MTKKEFIKKCHSIVKEIMKYEDGCFLLECSKCGNGVYCFEGTFDALYDRYLKGCSVCKNMKLELKPEHGEL